MQTRYYILIESNFVHFLCISNFTVIPVLWVVMVISWWWVIISSGHHGVPARRWWAIGIPISWHGGYNIEEMGGKTYLSAILQTTHLIDCREATTKEWSVHLRPALFRVAKKLFFTIRTSTHWAWHGRSFRWRTSSITNRWSPLHRRGSSGWHSFEKGISIPRIIIVI